jgi:hypothetical protein
MIGNMTPIERAVQKALVDISERPPQGNTAWTQAIMNSLTALGDAYGFYVYGPKRNKIDNTITACLYDMLWYTPKALDYLPGSNIIFDKIHLALECEWKRHIGEIMYDFQKLVQARADHRVIIFESDETEKMIERMIQYAKSSPLSVKGDRYLIAAVRAQDGASFNFKSYVKT